MFTSLSILQVLRKVKWTLLGHFSKDLNGKDSTVSSCYFKERHITLVHEMEWKLRITQRCNVDACLAMLL